MSCLRFNQTITKSCRSTPGVSLLYIANYEDIISYTLNGTEDKVIEVSGYTASGESSGFWYSVKPNRETASFTDEKLVEVSNGAYIHKPQVTFKLGSLEPEVRTVFNNLSTATVVIAVKTNDNKIYILGKDNGLDIESGNATSGTAATDMKGVEITVSGLEHSSFIEIDTDQYDITTDVVS